MSRHLRQGEFFGTTYARGGAGGVVLSALRHAAARRLPVHEHESAYFSMLLRGAYCERAGRAEFSYRPLTAVFHPASFAHLDEVGTADSTILTLEVPERFFETHDLARPTLSTQPIAASRTLLTLYAATKAQTATALDVESAAIELLAGAAKTLTTNEHHPPPWLARVIDRLHDEEPARIGELARDANVHPVHLTRVFRRHVGMNPGAYAQRVRLERALARIASGASLAEVALSSGFADQSHFTRAIREALGMTPRALALLVT